MNIYINKNIIMGRFDEVKATINANIKTNGKQEITGSILNSVMTEMVDATETQVVELSEGINGRAVELQGTRMAGNLNSGGGITATDSLFYMCYELASIDRSTVIKVFTTMVNQYSTLWALHSALATSDNSSLIAKGDLTSVKNYDEIDLSEYPNAKYLYLMIGYPTDSASATYTQGGLNSLINEVKEELSEVTQEKEHIHPNVMTSGCIDKDGNIQPSEGYVVTQPIFLSKGTELVYRVLCDSTYAELARYIEGRYVPIIMGRYSYTDHAYVIEESGYYVFTTRNESKYPTYAFVGRIEKKATLERIEDLEQKVAEISSACVNNINDVLFGKKYVSCGDSFTAYTNAQFEEGPYQGKDKTYPYLIGLRTGMIVENMAVSGMSLVKAEASDNYFSGDYYKKIPTDVDYITIKLGINDVNYGSPIGTIADTTTATFYGAWNVVLDYLIRNYPLAKIGIIVTNGATLEVMEAERQIARKWGIPYLDYADSQTPVMCRMVGLRNDVNSSVLQLRHDQFKISSSDTHPNASAHEYESTFIEAFLRRL